jgi:hypothetical protein
MTVESYATDGFLSPVDISTADEAANHRTLLQQAEAKIGALHYRTKIHTILTSPLAVATDERALDVAETLIGPDILVYNVTYIIKEAGAPAHVSWHQDLTYWGVRRRRPGVHVACPVTGNGRQRLHEDAAGQPPARPV